MIAQPLSAHSKTGARWPAAPHEALLHAACRKHVVRCRQVAHCKCQTVHVLYAASCMVHAVWCMLYMAGRVSYSPSGLMLGRRILHVESRAPAGRLHEATVCCLPHVVCQTLSAARCPPHVVHRTLSAARCLSRCVLHGARCMPHATHCLSHVVCHTSSRTLRDGPGRHSKCRQMAAAVHSTAAGHTTA